MRHHRWKALLSLLLVLAMIAAACGDDDDDGGDGGTEETTTTTAADGDDGAAEETTTTAAAEGDDGEADGGEGDGDGGEGDDGDEGAAGDLVTTDDSGRLVAGTCPDGENNEDASIGVTADSVNIALVSIDFGPLAELGFAASGTDVTMLAQPFVDAVNEAGGICGRQIDYQPVLYDIISGEGGQACIEVTEDRSNLLVLGQGGFNEALCIAEAGTVTYTQQDFSEGEIEASGGDQGILFSRAPSVEATYRATVENFLPDLEGKTVGVWYGAVFPSQGDAVEAEVLPMLDEAGIEYQAFRTDSTGPTDPEGAAILSTAATEFVGSGVDAVLGFTQTTNHVGLQGEMAQQGLIPEWYWSNIGSNTANELFAETFGVQDIADGERVMTYTLPPPDAAEEPSVISCNEQYTELTGESFEPGTFDYQALANVCHQVDMVAALLTLVGPEITQDALVTAFETLPNHPMGPMIGGEQWGPGERFGVSQMAETVYDGSANVYSIEGEPFEIS